MCRSAQGSLAKGTRCGDAASGGVDGVDDLYLLPVELDLTGVGEHEADQIAPAQSGRAQGGGDSERRRLELRVRAELIPFIGDETIARISARGVRQRVRQRA